MLANRKTLEAGVETEFLFDRFGSNSVLVKNETAGAVLFCDGLFDADKAANIPAFHGKCSMSQSISEEYPYLP